MFSDPWLYSRFHSMQVGDSNKLLDCVLPEMSFKEEDVIMDVGCGSGDNTKLVLLPRIPRLKKLVAIDCTPPMIEFARENMVSPKIEYCLADIEDRSSLKQWEGSISKIFSIHCFHWLKNQKKGFESLHFLLKPKGEAALVFVLSTPWWDSYPLLINDPKWSKYLKGAETYVPKSHHLNYRSDHFRALLEDLGFEVLRCQDSERSFSFQNTTTYRNTFRTLSALPVYIPEELREEFIDDLLAELFKTFPHNSEGFPIFSKTVLTVHIRKT